MANRFDVVVVPDFTGTKAPTFEARTLFFLASWLENAGQARQFPLHVACIGNPPSSVQWLAERSQASITVHQPLDADRRRRSNKLRGLEVRGQEDRVLLLDTDILVLADISELAEISYSIAAAPANQPRVPERCWRKIYSALGMDLPTERIASVRGELTCPVLKRTTYVEQRFELNAMVPYYNAGIVFAPWDCGLRPLWEDHIRRIAALFHDGDDAWLGAVDSDQAGFATSVELLKRRGVPFVRLPYAFHAHRLHIYRGALPVRDIKLFHAFDSFRKMSVFREMTPDKDALRRALGHYPKTLVRDIAGEWWRQDGKRFYLASIVRHLLPSTRDVYHLGNVLSRLYERHVIPALRHARSAIGD